MRPFNAGNCKMCGLAPQLERIKAAQLGERYRRPHTDVLIWVPPSLMAAAPSITLVGTAT